MATYSYSIETKIPLTPQQVTTWNRTGDIPASVRSASENETRALARATFGSSWTPGSIDVAFVQNGNYIKSTQITSPSEVPAASLPPGIAPIEGDVNRLVEARTPVTTEDTPLSPIEPTVVTSSPVVPGPVIDTPTPAIVVVTTPAAEPVPVTPPPAAPLAFEPLTVGGRILAPAEFAGAADTLVVTPPTTTPTPVVGDEALAAAQDAQDVRDLQIAAESATPVPPEDDGYPPPPEYDDRPIEFNAEPLDPETEALLEQQAAINRAQLQQQEALAYGPAPVPPSQVGSPNGQPYDDNGFLNPGWSLDENNNPVYVGPGFVEPATQASADASRTAARTINSQKQSTLQARITQPSAADWRVRLQLADGSNYLYNEPVAANRGILAPLYDTAGVVFPYTPSIETNYKAKYTPYDLIHSNYRGYFYQNSSVDEISIKGTFTAQDTTEAQYLLAVIHFFRSVTKMFYGQGANVGTPPPLVFLSGLGQYQFNKHPCVVSSFNYSLPTDVDYIRAEGFNNIGLNLENRRSLGSGPAMGGALGTIQRLLTNKLFAGAEKTSPWPSAVNQNVSNKTTLNSTYVPTKMEISIQLLPIQTRNQVSQQFSLQGFANGKLLTQGFW